MATLRRRPGAGLGAGDHRQPRARLRLARPRPRPARRARGRGRSAPGSPSRCTGEGADDVPRDESHLVVRAMRAAFDAMGAQPPGLRLACPNVIPHARGLGLVLGGDRRPASCWPAALVAGGTAAAGRRRGARAGRRTRGSPRQRRAGAARRLRRSPAATTTGATPPAPPVDPRVAAVVFVPPDPVSTEVARGLLPADGAARRRGRQRRPGGAAGRRARPAARAAAGGRPATACTRTTASPAMPESLALVDALRADGVAGRRLRCRADGAGVRRRGRRDAGRRDVLGRLPGRAGPRTTSRSTATARWRRLTGRSSAWRAHPA